MFVAKKEFGPQLTEDCDQNAFVNSLQRLWCFASEPVWTKFRTLTVSSSSLNGHQCLDEHIQSDKGFGAEKIDVGSMPTDRMTFHRRPNSYMAAENELKLI